MSQRPPRVQVVVCLFSYRSSVAFLRGLWLTRGVRRSTMTAQTYNAAVKRLSWPYGAIFFGLVIPDVMERGSRAFESRIRPTTLSIGASLIRRTPSIAVSVAFLAFTASDCNGWARAWGFGTGTREAPNKSIRLVRVSFRARRIGARVPSVRAWRRQEALFGGQG